MLKLILLLYNLFKCIIVVICMIENELPKAFFQQSHFHILFNSQLNMLQILIKKIALLAF